MAGFNRIKEILDNSVGGVDVEIGVHGAFWRNVPLEDFISTPVAGETLLIVGNGAESNLVKALKGQDPFGDDGSYSRMPTGLDATPPDEIAEIEQWINDGCPEEDSGQSVKDIKEIRILPPLAVGRLGSSPEPMHNYRLEVDDAAGFRKVHPAETLVVEPTSGAIVGTKMPTEVRFKDGSGRIKPVAPFLEAWVLLDGEEELCPLTTAELDKINLTPADLSWSVAVANRKMYRRTGDPGDVISDEIHGIADHGSRELRGYSGNFKSGRSISLGSVQYIQPNDAFPEIRFRFTPPAGAVFGSAADGIIPSENAVYDAAAGSWDGYSDGDDPSRPPLARYTTAPQSIFARDESTGLGLGYFDDSCDGVVTLSLTKPNGETLQGYARVASGPPDFAPDSLPVRSMADDLEQMAYGPTIAAGDSVSSDEVRDIVRRALETLQLMSSETENRRFGSPFDTEEVEYGRVRDIHHGILTSLLGLDSPPNSAERQDAYGALVMVKNALREYRNAPDTSREGSHKMPALMRGADGMRLALPRRQIEKLERAINIFEPIPDDVGPVAAMKRMISSFASVAILHSSFVQDDGTNLGDVFTDPEAVLNYLKAAKAQGGVAEDMGLDGQTLVKPGDAGGSPFVALLENSDHPMNGPLGGYSDQLSNVSGIEVVKNWITSLADG